MIYFIVDMGILYKRVPELRMDDEALRISDELVQHSLGLIGIAERISAEEVEVTGSEMAHYDQKLAGFMEQIKALEEDVAWRQNVA